MMRIMIKSRRNPRERTRRQRLQQCSRMMKTLIFRMLNLGYGRWKTVMIWSWIFRVL
jgi:hypothetical protein